MRPSWFARLSRLASRSRWWRWAATPRAFPAGINRVAEAVHPPGNAGWTLIGLPRTAARAGVDLIHAPAYTAPFWAGVPVVLTIHDVSYEIHPEWYPYRRDVLRRLYYRGSAGARHTC
jgi:hypothetical protein